MSEKRFVLCKKGDVEYIEDNGCVQLYGFDVLCEMLNEQQATIQSLEEENEQLRNSMKKLENVDLVIELKYSYGYEKYLADVRVVDNE